MSELKPCPFCGGEAVFHDCLRPPETYPCRVYCDNCWAEVGGYSTEAEAIAAWNTRVDYHGYEQAAIEAWESIKAWNSRAERICKPTEEGCCPYCGEDLIRCDVGVGELGGAIELDPPIYHNYCPNCGAKVVGE